MLEKEKRSEYLTANQKRNKMEVNQKIVQKLNLPDMSQIGIVVKDVNRTIEHYEKVLGLGPFVVPEITYFDTHYHGRPANFSFKMGFCSLGTVELELIEPLAPPTIYHDFLKEKGEGIHHLGFDVKDMDEKILLCKGLGIDVLQMGRTPAGGFAYLNTEKIGGVIFELIQRKCRRA
jgi:methylmalonyl-CoA/ethylmalonyl-CoA epimerase